MTKFLKIVGLTAILILAAFLRSFRLTQLPPGLYPDEAMNGNNALEALTTGQFKIFYPENNGREGLFINIQAIFLKFLLPLTNGVPESWMLRVPSVLFGITTVLGIYFLTKELFKNHKLALLTAFLLSVSFWHLNFSRIGFRAIMAPAFLTWAIYFLIKSLQNQNTKFYIFTAIIGGLFYGLGFHSYIAYRITPLLIVFIFWFYWRQAKKQNRYKQLLLSAFYFLFFAFMTFLPLGLYFLNHPQDLFGRTTQISIFNSPTPLKDLGFNILKTAGMFNLAGDTNWRHNIAGQPLLFWPIGLLFLIGLILIIKKLKNRRLEISLPFIWLIITGIPVIISNEGLPHALRAILMVPAVFIIAAFGGFESYQWLIAKNLSPRLLTFIYIFFLISLIIQVYYNYFIIWGLNPKTAEAFNQNYSIIAKQIRNLPDEMPKYIIIKANGVDVRGWPMPAQTVMFLTDTFTKEKQERKNIFYLKAAQEDLAPKNMPFFIID